MMFATYAHALGHERRLAGPRIARDDEDLAVVAVGDIGDDTGALGLSSAEELCMTGYEPLVVGALALMQLPLVQTQAI